MKRKLAITTCLLVVAGMTAFFLGMTAVEAIPLDYIFTGTATAWYNGERFENKEFNVVFHADSDNVVEFAPHYFVNYPLNASISIADVGTFTFLNQLYVQVYQPSNYVGFGELTNGDLLDIQLPGLDTYDLRSSFGPVATSTSYYLSWNNVALNNGSTLSFTNVSNPTFQDPPGAAVPEPATVLLVGCGLLGLAGVRRKFKK